MVISTSNAWIKVFNPYSNPSLRLFCFPYAGGNAAIFRDWSNCLPIGVEVCAIQLPGRADRLNEVPFTDLSLLVEQLTPVLDPYLNVPFAFFGHSMGALISFELARQLRNQNAPDPVHLFVSGRRAPQIRDRNPSIHTLPDSDFLAELRYLNGTPRQVLENDELMKFLLPTLRADFSICSTYVYLSEPPLSCPISVFGGTEDNTEPSHLLEQWNTQTSSLFALYMFPGDHFFLNANQKQLLKKLSHELNQCL